MTEDAVALRMLYPDDLDALYHLLLEGEGALGRLFRGGTPSPHEFANEIWGGVLCQYVGTKNDVPIALYVAHSSNIQDGFVHLAVVDMASDRLRNEVGEGLRLFVGRLFDGWPFRKIYADVSEAELERFLVWGGALFVQELHFPEHEFRRGRYESAYVFGLFRSEWVELQ